MPIHVSTKKGDGDQAGVTPEKINQSGELNAYPVQVSTLIRL